MRSMSFLVFGLVACAAGCNSEPLANQSARPVTVAVAPPPPTGATVVGSAVEPSVESFDAPTAEFPVIPPIMVPSIVGSGDAQRALETSMKSLIDPIAGITVRPANCSTNGTLINETGFTNVDTQGNIERVGEEGVFNIAADGSGTSTGAHGTVEVRADGSGTIVNDAGSFEISADGSGEYVGAFGSIKLDGKGAGSWVGEHGNIENHGDGSGSWVGEEGSVEIHADGSGKWIGGPEGIIENRGDGTGLLGAAEIEMKMAPLAPLPPAGRFPLLNKFSPPGAPCGCVITLTDRVLFDFDQSNIRADADDILNTLAEALNEIPATTVEIRGHTDAKGSEDYNLKLSERRAQAVIAALRKHDTASGGTARGFGESQPVAPNETDGKDNPAGRQLNRRVEIFVRT